jgi:hypothetical protein
MVQRAAGTALAGLRQKTAPFYRSDKRKGTPKGALICSIKWI